MKNTVELGKLATVRGLAFRHLSEVIPGRYGIHFTGLIEDFSGFEVHHLSQEEIEWRQKMIDYLAARNKADEGDPRVKLTNVLMEMSGIILLTMAATAGCSLSINESIKKLGLENDHPGTTFLFHGRFRELADSLMADPSVHEALQADKFSKKLLSLAARKYL